MNTLPKLLKERARWYKEKTLFYCDNKTLSYRDYDQITSRIAAGLRGLGVNHGDRVAVILPNGLDIAQCYWAIWKAGAIYLSINPMLNPNEIAYIAGNSEAKFMITSSQYLANVKAACPELPNLQGVIVVDDQEVTGTISYRRLQEQETCLEGDEVVPDDVAVIMYTSGTTGKPKGAMLTHRNLIFNSLAQVEIAGFNEHDKALCVLPLFHLYALSVNLLNTVLSGGSLVILESFVVGKVMETIQRHMITIFVGVPTMLNYLVKSPERSDYDLRSLRFVHTGAAPVPVEVIKAFHEEFGCRVLEGYGQTEASSTISFNPYFGEQRVGTAGLPLRGIPVRIVHENDEDVPVGEVGEIICTGPTVMKGYWMMPEVTARTLRGGWLHTGDFGRMDENGYIIMVDRMKDMIVTGGFNIYPKELEEVIYTHPAVLEAAVVGVPDGAKGEILKAFVALKPGYSLTEEEFFRFCRSQLDDYKVPQQVQFLDALPKTPTGKITKVALRQMQNK